MRSLVGALLVALVAQLARADLIHDATLRWIVADAELAGGNGDQVHLEDLHRLPGFYANALHAVVDRGSSGYASGLGAGTSDFRAGSVSARGVVSLEAFIDGSFIEASAGGLSFAAGDFHVTESQSFRLSATIIWSNSPDLCVVVLRETNGLEHFVLEASGAGGSASAEAEVVLERGKFYSLFGIVAGSVLVEGGSDPAEGYAEFSFSFEPVPGAPTLGLLSFAGAWGVRRTRR